MNILRNADLANYDLSDLSETLNNYHSHHPLNTVSSYVDFVSDKKVPYELRLRNEKI